MICAEIPGSRQVSIVNGFGHDARQGDSLQPAQHAGYQFNCGQIPILSVRHGGLNGQS